MSLKDAVTDVYHKVHTYTKHTWWSSWCSSHRLILRLEFTSWRCRRCSTSAGCRKITVDKDGGIHSCADARMTNTLSLYAKTTSSSSTNVPSSSRQTVTGSFSERFNFCFATNPFHAPQYQLSVIDIMSQQMQYRTFWGRFNAYMTKTCIRTLQKTLVFQLASAC